MTPATPRQQIIDAFPLDKQLVADGIELIGGGVEKSVKCPFHKDGTASVRVNVAKQTWFCNACNIGGSIIDYLAKRDGKPVDDVYRALAEILEKTPPAFNPPPPGRDERPSVIYTYQDATSREVYRVCKYVKDGKKTFRQQRRTADGWQWNMDGVERVLYRLPEVLSTPSDGYVVAVEGEKDVESLRDIGLIATCNVGGAGKWLDGYTDSVKGKDLVLCGDNDEPGRAHIRRVIEAVDGKVKRLRHVIVPEPAKDISDYLATAQNQDEALAMWEELLSKAAVIGAGSTVPILSMEEAEVRYQEFIKSIETLSYSFAGWLPTFGRRIRPCVPGDVIVWVAPTGTGKTFLLQNMAYWAAPLPTVLFEMELADSLTFERFVSIAMRERGDVIEEEYKAGRVPNWRANGRLQNIFVCPKSSLTVPEIETIIMRSELKIGRKPVLVMVDYMQLLNGLGKSRYEKMTDAMAALKSMAKSTGTIVVVASQIMRKKGDESEEVGVNDGKDSGQIENSASLMLGAWQQKDDPMTLNLRVLKNTKGFPGLSIQCNFDGARGIITERVERM